MRTLPHPLTACVLLLALCAAAAQAQSPAAAPAGQPPGADALERQAAEPGRHDQRIERIDLQDNGARVQELREGGETRRITVQPSGSMPAYDVRPASPHGPREGGPGAAGQRTWKVLSF